MVKIVMVECVKNVTKKNQEVMLEGQGKEGGRKMNELKNIKLRNLLKVLLNSLLWGFIIAPAYYNRFLNIQADILKIGGKKT